MTPELMDAVGKLSGWGLALLMLWGFWKRDEKHRDQTIEREIRVTEVLNSAAQVIENNTEAVRTNTEAVKDLRRAGGP